MREAGWVQRSSQCVVDLAGLDWPAAEIGKDEAAFHPLTRPRFSIRRLADVGATCGGPGLTDARSAGSARSSAERTLGPGRVAAVGIVG